MDLPNYDLTCNMGLANLHPDSEITECVFAAQRSCLTLIRTSTLVCRA